MKRWDIIIAGGGPAGLSLAADLSRDFRVLVLEKQKAGTTTRAWYTFQDRIKANDLDEAVVATPENLSFYMNKESNISYKDKHALIDENLVLRIFKERTEANGSKVIGNTTVSDFSYDKQGIILKTSAGRYHGNLLVDCMGTTSPIVAKMGLQRDFNIWVVYGKKIKDTQFADSDTIGFYKMPEKYQPKNDKTNYMFGIYPKSKKSGDVYLFNYYNKIADPKILRVLFKKSASDFFPSFNETGVLRGLIYSGELEKYALDRILFVGDSGGLTPPAIGMGFNEILRKHNFISERIRHRMKHKQDLTEHALSDILLDYRGRPSYAFLRICQKYFYYGNNAEDWKNGISVLHKAGKVFTRKWMRNELDYSLIKKGIRAMIDVVGWTGLARILPLKEYVKFSLDSMKSIGSSLVDESHIAFHKQHGDKPSELCKNCGCNLSQ